MIPKKLEKNPSLTVKSFAIYLGDSENCIEPKNLGPDFIQVLELDASYFRPFIRGILRVYKKFTDLFVDDFQTLKNSAGKMHFKILIVDAAGNEFCRRFVLVSARNLETQQTTNDTLIDLEIVDIFGYKLISQDAQQDASADYYKNTHAGTPLEIVKKIVEDFLKSTKDFCKSCHDKEFKIIVRDDSPEKFAESEKVTFAPSSNESFWASIVSFLKQHNIRIYQDFDKMYIIRNFVVKPLEKSAYSDIGEAIYMEQVNKDQHPAKITDYIQFSSKLNALERPNVVISSNSGGKKQRTVEFSDKDLPLFLEMNGNSAEYKNARQEKPVTESSGTATIDSKIYENFMTFLSANQLVIFADSLLNLVQPGTSTAVKMSKKTEYHQERVAGDENLDGNWFITGTTMKYTHYGLFSRIRLNRFDNPSRMIDYNVVSGSCKKPMPNIASKTSAGNFSGLSSALDAFRNPFKSLQESISKFNLVTQTADVIRKTISQITGAIKQVTEHISKIKNELRNIRNKIKNSVKEVTSVPTEIYSEFISDFQVLKELVGSAGMKSELKKQLKLINNDISGINAAISDLKNEIKELSGEASSMPSKIMTDVEESLKQYDTSNVEARIEYLKNRKLQRLRGS